MNATERPLRGDVAATYDLGVEGYVASWSDVILPPARAVVERLGLTATSLVVDVGAGTGALVESIRDSALRGVVVAVDASAGMLRVAHERSDAMAVQGDALALPLGGECADAVLLAYVLFHVSDPNAAVAEAARVVRSGGSVGAVTWASEVTLPAFTVWNETLTDAGAPVPSPRRIDVGLDSPDAVTRLLETAGLRPRDVWTESVSRQWTLDSYWNLVTGSGLNKQRLAGLDQATREEVLRTARSRLSALEPEDFAYSGEVVCAVATRA